MKAIIYFGHHKVGSTALQSFLFRNQTTLMRAGLLYPGVETESLAYTISRLLSESDDLDPAQRARLEGTAIAHPAPLNAREPHNALAFQMLARVNKTKPPQWHAGLPAIGQMVRALRLQANFLQPEAVILCSEVMSNFGTRHPRLIEQVKKIYPDADHALYCVLRRPDEYLVSWHAQRLRFGDKVRSLSGGAAMAYTSTIHFDYRKTVEPWLKTFSGSPATLRNYADALKAGGSVEDFFESHDLAMPKGVQSVGRANESLPRAAMEVIRRANHDLAPPDATALFQYLLQNGSTLSPVPNKQVEMFGAELREKLVEAFAPIHDWLSQVTGQARFFPDFDEMLTTAPVPEEEAVAQLLGRLVPANMPNDPTRAFITRLKQEYGR